MENRNNYGFWIILIIIIIVGYFIYRVFFSETTVGTQTNTPTTTQNIIAAPSVQALDQAPGKQITVSSVNLERSGWVTIHKEENNNPGTVIGVSTLMPSGKTDNVVVPLTITTRNNERVYVMLHDDNGNGRFEYPGPDIPLKDSVGSIVMTRITISAGATSTGGQNIPTSQKVVSYTDNGFVPTSLEISRDETVRFINNSNSQMWVASDPHPVHNALPGFDENRAAGKGETYEYKFTKTGEWGFHNHVSPTKKGQITVR